MEKKMYHYIFLIGVILIVSYIGKKYVLYVDDEVYKRNEENNLIHKYLLNMSVEKITLTKKPKLWIHIDYTYNSRKWESFGSRSSFDLNQPYIHLTIKSIILHCGDDFEILLINDESFQNLLPDWEIDMNAVAGTLKLQCREYGMACLLYKYGGIIVPSTFLCMRSLYPLYENCLEYGKPFICENINRYASSSTANAHHFYSSMASAGGGGVKGAGGEAQEWNNINSRLDLMEQKNNSWNKRHVQKLAFMPDPSFMGAIKNDRVIASIVDVLKRRIYKPHLSSESEFLGFYSHLCYYFVERSQMHLIDGMYVGVKTAKTKKAILIDDLLSDGPIDFNPNMYGIYIDGKDILKRQKWQWFSVMSIHELLKQNIQVSRYFIDTMINYQGYQQIFQPLMT